MKRVLASLALAFLGGALFVAGCAWAVNRYLFAMPPATAPVASPP